MAEFWGFYPVDRKGLIFASYNSLDWKRVQPIALALRELGVPIWYDYGLQAGKKEWETQISRHIRISNALIIFVTKGIFQRTDSYVMWEFTRAQDLGRPYVPVYLDTEVLTVEFYQDWAKKYPDPFDKYVGYLDRWKRAEGVVCNPGSSTAELAQAIKQKLDLSGDINYKPEKWTAKDQNKAEGIKKKAGAAAQAETAVKPEIKVGSRVQFGRYPQNSYDPEPITWRVLSVIDGKALMITEDLLDARRFDAKRSNWERSELREWLNRDFMNIAFNSVERAKIVTMELPNTKKTLLGIKWAESSEDKVFCLSVGEAKECFSNDEERMAKPTAYARMNGANVDSNTGTGWWWLRSPEYGADLAAYVDFHGKFAGNGVFDWSAKCEGCGVRPVIVASL